MKARTFFLGVYFLFLLSQCSPAFALHILLYHNSLDGSGGTVLKCAAILRDAGHTVTVKDVRGRSYDPTHDHWGAPYDQVWDLRFVNEESTRCGSGNPSSPDYFTPQWRAKAVSFLNHCGRLFLAAENCQLTHRNEGIYPFLEQVGAVRAGFSTCGPSRNGNNITDGAAFYPVINGLGPISFFGALAGGLPVQSLTGTSFVETFVDWEGDHVNRSIASGWVGRQLGGTVDSPDCAKGRLFLVWDASMWPLLYKQGVAEDWDVDVLAGRDFTRRVFPAVARWLGRPDCPCQPPPKTTPMVSPTPKGDRRVLLPPPPPMPTVILKTPGLTPPHPSTPVFAASAPETLTFTELPVNIRVKLLDGPGGYRLDIHDAEGHWLRTLFDRTVAAEKETWATWDGLDTWGRRRTFGTYFAQLSKEGRPIRRIVLNWIVTK